MTFRDRLNSVIDWLHPPCCVECGNPGALICEACLAKVYRPEYGDYCPKCGKMILTPGKCSLCAGTDLKFRQSRAAFAYEGAVAAAIKRLKYHSNLGLADFFGTALADTYEQLGWHHDLAVPVPLSKERRRERGYNQTEWIAGAFSRHSGIPLCKTALFKIRHTISQVELDHEDRKMNLSGCFLAEPALVRGKEVLLIDDVMTTGTTFNECADTLLKAGAAAVDCLSVATAYLSQPAVRNTSGNPEE